MQVSLDFSMQSFLFSPLLFLVQSFTDIFVLVANFVNVSLGNVETLADIGNRVISS